MAPPVVHPWLKLSGRWIEAAAFAEMAPAVTPAQREQLRNVTLDQLIPTLASFGQHGEIVVRPARKSGPAGIGVSV